MYKLIIADIKVLGHRLWIIPMGVIAVIFTIIFGLSLYTGQPIEYVNFVITPIVLVFLGLELMRMYSGERLHTQLNSLPCSKTMIVLQKYFMFFIFFIVAIVLEYLFSILINLFNGKVNTVYLFEALNAVFLGSLRVLIMLMPLYFKIKNARKAFLLLIPWMIIPIIVSSTLVNEFLISYSDVNKAIFIYTTIAVLSISAMIVFYLKDKKQNSITDLLVFPIAIIFPISVAMTIEALNRVVFHYYIYRVIPENFDHGWYVWNMERYLRFFTIHSIVTLIVGAILIYVWKKGSVNKIIYNIYLIILLPILFFSLENTVRYVIYNRELLVGRDFIVNHVWSISQYIVFIPMLIVSIYYSKKFLQEGE